MMRRKIRNSIKHEKKVRLPIVTRDQTQNTLHKKHEDEEKGEYDTKNSAVKKTKDEMGRRVRVSEREIERREQSERKGGRGGRRRH